MRGTAWDAVRSLLHLALAGGVGALAWRLAGVHVDAEGEAAAPPWRRLRAPGAAALGLGLAIGTAAVAAAGAAALQRSGIGIEVVEGFVQLAFVATGGALFVRLRHGVPRPAAPPGAAVGSPAGSEAAAAAGAVSGASTGAASSASTGVATGSAMGAAAGAALLVAALVDLLRLPPLALPVLAGPFGGPAAVATAAEALPLVPWALAALLGVAAWSLLVRFVETLNAAELLNIDLEALVRERTVALEAQFARVRELERRETIAAERERLMRDMHDGVGGHLVSMLAMIEAGSQRRPAELAQVVRDALDDMRLMIDSLEPVDDDLNAVLAMFHDRLAPRLRAAGVALHWNVELLPQVNGLTGGLTPARVLHLLRMLQEAVTNALRHGRARTLWIGAEAEAAGGGVRIEVRDDGAGFDPQAVQATGGGRGLKNLARRAWEIGAELTITSAPGAGARVVVAWSSRPAGAGPAA